MCRNMPTSVSGLDQTQTIDSVGIIRIAYTLFLCPFGRLSVPI